MKIYIVVAGGSGWNGYEKYNVKAFDNQESAFTHARDCQQAVNVYKAKKELLGKRYLFYYPKYCGEKTEFDIINTFDPFYSPGDLDGIEYEVEELELIKNDRPSWYTQMIEGTYETKRNKY